jgi:hypothetical protein
MLVTAARPIGRAFLMGDFMTLKELLETIPFFAWLGENSTGVLWAVIIIMSLIEVSPVKINPWKLIGKGLQKFFGIADIREELMDNRRTRILRFDDEMMNGVHHRKDLFDSILIDCDKYETYCKNSKGYVNSVANDSIKRIRDTYHDLKNKGKFSTEYLKSLH